MTGAGKAGNHYARAQVVFSCGHVRHFTVPWPQRGEFLYCPQCGEAKMVAEAPEALRARCDHCRMSRTGTLDELRMTSSKHVLTRPTHVVRITDGLEDVEQVSSQAGELPFETITGERMKVAQEAQKSLRGLLDRVAGRD